MKLFFDITFPRSVDTHNEVSAVSAKLRIYKFNDPPNQWATATSYMGNTVTDRVSQVASQEGLTISVYQYMRPLRQNRREKKRLIDSRAVAWNKRSYIEFNIINAINYWQNNPNRNFGLFIEIEDPFGGRYNPELYITQMNCSVQNTPIPNLAQIYPEMDNESSLFNNDNFPTLDLLTIEIARQNSVSIVDTNRSTNFSNGKRKRDVNHKYMCRTIKRVISIKDLNLDDIILYPTTIEMAFCKGFCRTNQGNEYECKLTDYKDIEFIYLDSNSNPTIKTLKNFLPQSCQCVKRDTFD
ncbi:uncharacterized protein LOC128963684 [Oppia nitens]|uniref:uncharacterized protein LOC128963684 n=1 Tax=Oppia nitens TaxID=1686743 RepID=UPI0023DC7034|nr:uncharacterized protein LOC128963684 [Oppia nitens]